MCLTLIVEDNLTFRTSLKEILRARFPSLSVEEAGDGKEAMQKVGTRLPDLIFMDVKLPGTNGLELTKRIKAEHEHVCIAVLTSYDLPEYREAAFRCGANYFLTKGEVTSEEISALVDLVIGGGAGADSTAGSVA